MIRQNKQVFVLLGITTLLVLIVLILTFSLMFGDQSENQKADTAILPTPTLVPYARNEQGKLAFTPLQKTTIGKTQQQEIEKNEKIISKRTRGDITLYEVSSATQFQTDEIRVQNGVVIFESTHTFNTRAGQPPKLDVYKKGFGQPEEVLKSVSPLGQHISAYIYAKDGFTIFANHNTTTVYEIHRFPPMSSSEYKNQYAEYLQPAPEYPKEFSDVE